jgi:hypothetical protein
MSRESNDREAYYSAGRMFGLASQGFLVEGGPVISTPP